MTITSTPAAKLSSTNKKSQQEAGFFYLKNGCGEARLPELSEAHVIIQLNLPDYGRISEEFLDLYKKGVSLNEIARITGKSKARVRTVLHRHGIDTRPPVCESKYTAWRKGSRSKAHPPFGSTYYLGELVREPREHQILLLIERLSGEGVNPNAIAAHLNSRGMRPRRAVGWNRNSVVKILDRFRSGFE